MAYAFKAAPGDRITLADYDPDFDAYLTPEQGQEEFTALSEELGELQQLCFACRRNSILLIFQGLDTSGKDGAIRNALRQVSQQGCRVEAFKQPTEEELSHDFLWRYHRVAPSKGIIGVFNRSYYEDVLAVRVHKYVPPDVWMARYAYINDFERMLGASGAIILKFFLYISHEEQERRLLAREQKKRWKLSPSDWRERALWNDYTDAYEDALSFCSTAEAPWYVVPSNKKWYRNLAVCEAVVQTLRSYQHSWLSALEEIEER